MAAGKWWQLAVRRSRSVLPDLVHGQVAGAGGWSEGDLRATRSGPWCLAFALRARQVHGIWGGLTEEVRHQAAKTARDRRAQAASQPAGADRRGSSPADLC
jgi:hypothetical protein